MKQQAQHFVRRHISCIKCALKDLVCETCSTLPNLLTCAGNPKAMHHHPPGMQLARSQRCAPDVHSRLSGCKRQMSDSETSWSRPVLLAKVYGKGLSSA